MAGIGIKISNVEFVPTKFKSGLVGFASCQIGKKIYLGNIAVYSLRDGSGFRCVYPQKILKNGSKIPIFYPVDEESNKAITEAITAKVKEILMSTMEGGENGKH